MNCKIILNTLLIGCILFASSPLCAQLTITGTVLDNQDNPLIGVNIIEVDTQNGTITDIDGSFTFNSDRDTTSIELSYLGYTKYRIENITNDTTLVIPMQADFSFEPGCSVIILAPETKVVQNYTQLKRDQLTLNPSANISEALNATPGVVMQSGTYGTNRLTMRGIGSRNQFGTAKILGYWNGIPLTNTRGELAIDDLNLNMVGEVEVMRGPTAPQYGSALGGVLNFKTIMPRSTGLQSSISVGSYGLINQSHIVNLRGMENRLKGKIGLGTLSSDGWRQNNQYKRRNINGQFTFTAGKRSNVIVSALFADVDVLGEIPSSINSEDFENNPSLAASNWFGVRGFEDYRRQQLGLAVEVGTVSNWLFKLAHSTTRYLNDELRPFNTLADEHNGRALRFTSSKEELFGHDLRLEAGVEVLTEGRDWNTKRDSIIQDDFRDAARNWMEYINLKYRIDGNISLDLGVSSAQHFYQLFGETDTTEVDFGKMNYTNLSPSLKVSRSTKFNTLQYLSIAHGFSPPNSDEILNSDSRVNTEILPESGWTFEAGVKDYRERLKYDVTAYYMPTANLLVPRRISEELTIGVNAGKTQHFGLEIASYYDDLKTGDVTHYAKVMLSLSHNTFVDFVLDGEQFSGNQVTGVAPITAALSWKSVYKGLEAQLNFQYRSSLPIDDANTVMSDAFSLVNAQIGYQRELRRSPTVSGFIRVNGNNLLNQNYASMVLVNASSFGGSLPRYYYPGMPRNIVATFGVSLDLD